MGLLGGLLGNASEVDPAKLEGEFANLLADSERLEKAFQLVRDLFVFTNKRLILVDKQGVTGRKVEYLSIPYKSITRFSVETAGRFDYDAEMKIWVSSGRDPIVKEFKKGSNLIGVQKTLADYVLK